MDNYDDLNVNCGETIELDLQQDTVVPDVSKTVPQMDVNSFSRQDLFDFDDPLKHASEYQMAPCQIGLEGKHFVNPHHVDGYYRGDGTYVDGYFRDGDGNTEVDRGVNEGGGYYRG